MSFKIDKELVRDSYSRMPDHELIRIATHDAQGLAPEAQEILIEEIEKRKLSTNLVKGVAIQNAIQTEQDIADLCSQIQNLPCPTCSDNTAQLNAILTVEVMSFVLFTHSEKKVRIACPACLSKANTNAWVKSVALGWWGIPWGIVRTIDSIITSRHNKKDLSQKEPTPIMRSFVLANRGVIECYKDEPEQLKSKLFS